MDEDLLYFQEQLEVYKKEYLEEVKQEAEKIYKENIMISMYQNYQPTQYNRTGALENSVASKIEGDTVLLYNDNNEMDYYSAVSGEPVIGDDVVKWTNYGHHDDTGIGGMYHDYNGRQYIKKTKEDIENEFPDIDVEITGE